MNMSEKVFFVRIEMGNDGMSTSQHVAWALNDISRRIESNKYLEDPEFEELTRGVKDNNGNTVGSWGWKNEE